MSSPGSIGDVWDRFSRETFGEPYLVWHDGLDFDALRQRWNTHPAVVASALSAGLAKADPVAAAAIGFLARHREPLPWAESELRAALGMAKGEFRVRVAQALFALTADDQIHSVICDVLTTEPSWSVRIDAAIALSEFDPTRDVIHALAHGVQDSQYLVRRHSAQSLLTLDGRGATIEDESALWECIRASEPARWRTAATELTKPWAR